LNVYGFVFSPTDSAEEAIILIILGVFFGSRKTEFRALVNFINSVNPTFVGSVKPWKKQVQKFQSLMNPIKVKTLYLCQI